MSETYEDDDEGMGSPKAPKLPFNGRPNRPCPGAPSKGKAPRCFFDLSDEAPVRRLDFADSLESPNGPPASNASGEMEASPVHSPSTENQLQLEQWARFAPVQQSWHLQQQCPHDQVQQQPLQQPQQSQQHHQLTDQVQQQPLQQLEQSQQSQQLTLQSQQQQLGLPWSSKQLHQHQHWLHPSGPTAQQQQQQPQWNPLSPSGRPRVPEQQNSSTPARLFR